MKKLVALSATVVQIFTGICTAQESKKTTGSSFVALNAYSQQFNNAIATYNNPAALSPIKQMAVGLVGERRFLLKELNSYLLCIAIPVPGGAFGLTVTRFGFNGFNETEAGLGYGRTLGKKMAVGGRINYFNRQVPGYGRATVVNGEAGLLLFLTNKCTAGIQVYNPIARSFGLNKEEQLAAIYRFGLGYDVSKAVLLVAEVLKKENEPVQLSSAIFYRFEKQFFAQFGIRSGTPAVFAGAGLLLNKQFRLDVLVTHQRPLGITPGLMLHYSFNKTRP